METRSGSTTIVITQVGTTAHEVNTLNSNWDTPCHSFLDIIQEIGEFCQPSYNRWVRVPPDTNTGRLILLLHLLDHAVQVMARTPRLDSPIFTLTLRDSIHPTDTFVAETFFDGHFHDATDCLRSLQCSFNWLGNA